MKPTVLVVLLGMATGLVVQSAYFHFRAPDRTPDGDPLAWMKTELRLSSAQYASVRALHEASEPQFRQLNARVLKIRAEFAEFERGRRERDRVDYVEFARFVADRERTDRECLGSTRRLILASARIMTPEQRSRYLGFVLAADPGVVGSPN